MQRLPDAVVIVDLKKEAIGVREANRLGLAVIGLVDTNCDPDEATYVIPGNDDAIRACNLVLGALADAVLEGKSALPDSRRAGGRRGRRRGARRRGAGRRAAPGSRVAEEPVAEEPVAEAAGRRGAGRRGAAVEAPVETLRPAAEAPARARGRARARARSAG